MARISWPRISWPVAHAYLQAATNSLVTSIIVWYLGLGKPSRITTSSSNYSHRTRVDDRCGVVYMNNDHGKAFDNLNSMHWPLNESHKKCWDLQLKRAGEWSDIMNQGHVLVVAKHAGPLESGCGHSVEEFPRADRCSPKQSVALSRQQNTSHFRQR
ncbi:hypothetical protein V8E54_012646 [Elaphomyces granulatus]